MPLVTVAVITYNSSEFVLETLESVKKQTYKNIELIISDDCSKDNTIDICEKWIEVNKKCFARVQLITSPQNTGIVGNDNRAISASSGEWIKLIAGDDVLFSDAISSYIKFVNANPEVKCCLGKVVTFSGLIPEEGNHKTDFFIERLMFGAKSSAKWQFNILIHTFAGSGNSYFTKKEIYDKIGGYDERFPLQEDHAFFIKLTKNGYKIHLLDKNTVFYRINPESVCHKDAAGKYFSPQEIRYIQQYKYEYCMENLWMFGRIMLRYSLWIKNKVIENGNSHAILKCRIYYIIYSITDPINWERRMMAIASKFC